MPIHAIRERPLASESPSGELQSAALAFSRAVDESIARGRPEDIPLDLLQWVMRSAVKAYSASVEKSGPTLSPVPDGAVTVTEAANAVCGIIRAAELNILDVAMWYRRFPSE